MRSCNCLPLWIAFSNFPVFGYRFQGTRGDGRQKRKELKLAFSKENGYMWTERCSKRKKRLLFSC